jgi:uncharacterized damage-inducible protein DinB
MSVDLETLRKLFTFNRWANRKTLDSVAVLTAEEYVQPAGGSFGSVHGTLVHLYGADWVWLERFHGRSPRSLPAGESFSTLEELQRKWSAVEAGHEAFLASLTPDRLLEEFSYVNFAGEGMTYPYGEALLHLANHGTYHRGQIATLLRQLGKKAISTDYLRWIDALRAEAAP